VGILKKSSKVSSGIGVAMVEQVTVKGEKKNSENDKFTAENIGDDEAVTANITDPTTNDSPVVQTDNMHQVIHANTTIEIKSKVDETMNNNDASMPPVTNEPVPPVTVEPIPPVTVEPIPPVTIEPIPPVTIEPIPPVTVEPISPVTVDQELQSNPRVADHTNAVCSTDQDVTQAKSKKSKFGKKNKNTSTEGRTIL